MIKQLLILLSIVVCLGISDEARGQSINDIRRLDVEKLTDEQVDKLRKEIKTRGLTTEQALRSARARGASEVQISKLERKLRQPPVEKPKAIKDTTELATALNDTTELEIEPLREVDEDEENRNFGHSLFNSKNLTFSPSANIPIPSNYILSIGDELLVTVWGSSQQSYSLVVSRNGTITIPEVGVVSSVAGSTFASTSARIKAKLSEIYSDMKSANPSTFADVALEQVMPIQVNIVGEASLPGTYTLPGTASAFNALFLSGGPNSNGSFRNIQIIRDNKLIQTIDVYDYLLNKKLSGNIGLRNQDVIYIPVYQTKVDMSADFKRNALFEMKEGESLADLFAYAGGLSDSVATNVLTIKRLSTKGYEQVSANLANLASCSLQNGDKVYVNPKNLEADYFAGVSIEGAVYEPGEYGLHEGMKLSELIAQAGGLVPDYYANRGLITRLDDKRFPEIIPFDVKQIQEGTSDVVLKVEDKVIIKNIFDVGEAKYVKIEGEVMEVGEYRYQKNMSLEDLIFIAGGMKESASEACVEIARRRSNKESAELSTESVKLFSFEVSRDLSLSNADADFILMPYDYVYIREAPSYEEQRTVTILGEVKYPGKYAVSAKDERISDLIRRAGGLTDFAFADAAHMNRGLDSRQMALVKRIDSQREGADKEIEVEVDLNQQLELQLANIMANPGKEYDYILKEGDVITIPVKKEEVWVNGAVLNPSGLAYDGKSMKKYIAAAGGFGNRAKKHKTFVIYPNGSSAATKGFFYRNYPEVKPGSQIVVPAKPEREKTPASTWVALASTITSIAVSLVAVFR